MRLTNNYNLKMPEGSDVVNIEDLNYNTNVIDNTLLQNKNDILNINNDLSKTENTKYTTKNGIKEFSCKDGYVDNVVIEGQTKILNNNNEKVEAGTPGAKLVSVGQGDKIEILTKSYDKTKQDKKQISTTLRSLPNGVRDTIEKIGNKYVKVQRCGEILIDGSSYQIGTAKTNTIDHCIPVSDIKIGTVGEKNLYCDSVNVIEGTIDWNKDFEFIVVNTTEKNIIISLLKTKVNGQSQKLFKEYVSSNPITVAYELETPQIIELPNFNPQTYSDSTTLLLNTGAIQGECEFEVTNSKGSEIEVLKDKVGSLDDYINPNKIDFTSQCRLLNGWVVWGKNEFFNAFVVDNCVKVTCLIWQGTTDAYTSILKIPKMYAPISREFIPMVSDSGSCFIGCLDPDGYLNNESKISNFNWISFNFTYPLNK